MVIASGGVVGGVSGVCGGEGGGFASFVVGGQVVGRWEFRSRPMAVSAGVGFWKRVRRRGWRGVDG